MRNTEIIHPPTVDNTGGRVALSSTVTDEQDTAAGSTFNQPIYINMVATCDCYLIFGSTSTLTDITVTSTSGASRPFFLAAGTVVSFFISPRSRYFTAITSGTDTGYLYWWYDK